MHSFLFSKGLGFNVCCTVSSKSRLSQPVLCFFVCCIEFCSYHLNFSVISPRISAFRSLSECQINLLLIKHLPIILTHSLHTSYISHSFLYDFSNHNFVSSERPFCFSLSLGILNFSPLFTEVLTLEFETNF